MASRSAPAPSPGSGRAQQREATRERLIEGALACFERKSYLATTVEDILEEAGAGRATFYAHFTGKGALLISALGDLDPIVDASYERLNSQLNRRGELSRAQLHAWLTGWADEWERYAVLLRAAWQAATSDPGIHRRNLEVEARITELLTHYLERYQGASRERARMRSVLLQMMSERAFYTMISSIDFDREQALEVLSEFWWSVLSEGDQSVE
ncbi:TetR/AcrR family transcriptional regulator [Conexibacter sp. CPCC 206217]|uniref:TetR/AcrR family transcriptional regulator n=1 Tax=Conexibacter sp. CPCC 206217 TaxID=3064574 RepID=UPI00272066C0|nr:TetR/AcrR family transcriptional regulator [Conexibacter sp. CPCC 206217]MDO8212007.1 TetR/AcrR family transcriptional regulator [Conexibacter sp. CPCC 206217]